MRIQANGLLSLCLISFICKIGIIKKNKTYLIRFWWRENEWVHAKALRTISYYYHYHGFPVSSVGKKFACNAGDPGSIPGLGRSTGEGVSRLPTPVFLGFPCGSAGKKSSCNSGDLGLIPGLGRSPGKRIGYPLQYSGLENSMDSTWGCKELDMTKWLSLSL